MTSTDTDTPEPFAVGKVRVRVVKRRGHRLGDDGALRWYWRAERYQEGRSRGVWTGWGTVSEATQAVAAEVTKGAEDRPIRQAAAVKPIRTVCDLVIRWAEQIHLDNEHAHPEDRRSDRTLTLYAQHSEALCFWKRGSKDPDRWQVHPIAEVLLQDVTAQTIRDHIRLRREQSASSSAIAGELQALRLAWKYGAGVRWHMLPPLPAVKLKVRTVRPKHIPTWGEVQLLLRTVHIPWVEIALTLYAATGCRLSELATLTTDRIEFQQLQDLQDADAPPRLIAVLHVVGKTGPRSPAITAPGIVEALRAWITERGDAPLWPVTVSTWRSNMNNHLRAACDKAGVPYMTTNAFRRAVATALLRAPGLDLLAYKAQTGQSPETAMRSYTAPTTEDQIRAADLAKLGRLPAGQVLALPSPDEATRTPSPAQPRRVKR